MLLFRVLGVGTARTHLEMFSSWDKESIRYFQPLCSFTINHEQIFLEGFETGSVATRKMRSCQNPPRNSQCA